MVKVVNVLGDEYSGKVGECAVFAKWKGIQYRRKFVVPSNPNTTKQQAVRTNLALAVELWHGYITNQRQAYAYMSAGLRMSGFNLFTRRFQNAMPTSQDDVIPPEVGIKCIGNTKTTRQNTNPAPTNHSYTLSHHPVVIGSLTFTLAGADEAQDAYAEIQHGFVRIPTTISKADGAKAVGANLAAGDQLLISYQSSGREVTREVLYTIPTGESTIPAAATMQLALRTKYSPIDYGTVVIETDDKDGGANEFTQLESMEIDSVLGKVYYDLTDASNAASHVDYDSYTAVADVKLEAYKADTSFVAWRDYSDANGQLPLAFTIEDETYDMVYSKTGHTSVTKAAKTALLASLSEFIDIGTAT